MKFLAEIDKIIQETHDVKTFRFKKPKGFLFRSGQYCLLAFEDMQGDGRPFTLSNTPLDNHLDFTVKKICSFTSRLFELKLGDRLVVQGPIPSRLEFQKADKNIVFIAAGSGITPFISAIRYIVSKGLDNRLTLFFCNKTEKDIMFRHELECLEKEGRVKIVNTLTRQNWDKETGRVSKDMLLKHLENIKCKTFFVCGQPRMVSETKDILTKMGIERIKLEAW